MPVWPQRFSAGHNQRPQGCQERSPLSLQYLFSSGIYAAQLLSLSQAPMWYASFLLFLGCKQGVVGNQKNKYSWKPPPVADSLRRCPASMDTHAHAPTQHSPWTCLLQMAPSPCLTHPWWPWLLAATQPSFLCFPLHTFLTENTFSLSLQAIRVSFCNAGVSQRPWPVKGNDFAIG